MPYPFKTPQVRLEYDDHLDLFTAKVLVEGRGPGGAFVIGRPAMRLVVATASASSLAGQRGEKVVFTLSFTGRDVSPVARTRASTMYSLALTGIVPSVTQHSVPHSTSPGRIANPKRL